MRGYLALLCFFLLRAIRTSISFFVPWVFAKMIWRLFRSDKQAVAAPAAAPMPAQNNMALHVQRSHGMRIKARLRLPVQPANKQQVKDLHPPNGSGKLTSAAQQQDRSAPAPAPTSEPALARRPKMSMEDEIQASCRNGVLLIFPDICPNYLERVAAERNYDAEQVTTFVVDEVEQNRPYPRRPQTSVKRKREESNEPEPDLAGKFGNPVRDDEWDNGSYAELS
jgi:hypothetical protein